MRTVWVRSKTNKIKYLQFVNKLYKGDSGYVCTQRFSSEALVFGRTDFAKNCFIAPVLVVDDNKNIIAVSIFIHNPKLPFLQIGLFEAKENAEKAVELLINEAKKMAKEKKLEKIIVGLNGHLSYGVGILEEGFDKQMSFDSIYNKPYYKDYFLPYISNKERLCTYRAKVDEIANKLNNFTSNENIWIREADFKKDYDFEMELFRILSNQSLGNTYLYTEADYFHFEQQIKGLAPLLKDENLMFAMELRNLDGVPDIQEKGFLFWYPDYNSMLKPGRNYNILQLFLKMRKAYKKADTVKINAIGAVGGNPFITAQLIKVLGEKIVGKYTYIETTFIWDNNLKSKTLVQNLFGEPFRKYGVYFIEV